MTIANTTPIAVFSPGRALISSFSFISLYGVVEKVQQYKHIIELYKQTVKANRWRGRIFMYQAPAKIPNMKAITGISAMALLISVGSLESAGAWWVLPLTLGACSLAVLFLTCGRLGCFDTGQRDAGGPEEECGSEECQVVWLRERGAERRGGAGRPCSEPQHRAASARSAR